MTKRATPAPTIALRVPPEHQPIELTDLGRAALEHLRELPGAAEAQPETAPVAPAPAAQPRGWQPPAGRPRSRT